MTLQVVSQKRGLLTCEEQRKHSNTFCEKSLLNAPLHRVCAAADPSLRLVRSCTPRNSECDESIQSTHNNKINDDDNNNNSNSQNNAYLLLLKVNVIRIATALINRLYDVGVSSSRFEPLQGTLSVAIQHIVVGTAVVLETMLETVKNIRVHQR